MSNFSATMSNFRFREIGISESFNPSAIYVDAPFTQAPFYGDWQKSLNRKARRFLVTNTNDEVVAYFQLIKYPLPRGKSYIYIPYGPITRDFSEEFLIALKEELTRVAKTENAVFVRLDFTPPAPKEILSRFFIKAPTYQTYHSASFQPRGEWFLELKKSENDLLKEMHEKARYSIRLAERRGVTAEIITGDFKKYFEVFYELMTVTAKRNGFGLHPKNYYESVFESLPKIENSYLSVAKYNAKILVIYVIIPFGSIANYVYGGSSNEERNRMPTYLAHWRAICHAKQLNYTYYNFGGISNENNIYRNMENLTLYKKKFGGREMRHSDFFDIVINPLWYHLYNLRKFIKRLGL